MNHGTSMIVSLTTILYHGRVVWLISRYCLPPSYHGVLYALPGGPENAKMLVSMVGIKVVVNDQRKIDLVSTQPNHWDKIDHNSVIQHTNQLWNECFPLSILTIDK